jgi:hypothetical protein
MGRTLSEIEEIINKNNYNLIETYIVKEKNNLRRVIIESKEGYKYNISFMDFLNYGVPIANKSNPYCLKNISLWFYLNNKPFEVCEKTIYLGANKSIVFYCSNCDNNFTTTWAHIQDGRGCGVCEGKQVGWNNSLEYLRPDLAIEWDKSNRFSPSDVTLHSNKNIVWRCSKVYCGHVWKTTIAARVSGKEGLGCPACYGRVVSDKNRLAILFPIIYGQWHPTKNGKINPYDLSYGTPSKFWWLCNKCGEEFYSSVSGRTRIDGRGCPKCKESKGEKRIQEVLIYLGLKPNSDFQSQYRVDECRKVKPLPFDYCIFNNEHSKKILFLIEFQGEQHYKILRKGFFGGKKEFEKRRINDKIKQDYCYNNGIPLLTIPYTDFNNIEEILINTFKELRSE